MGTNTLAAKVTGNTVVATDPNQFRTAFIGDLVPRDTNGAAAADGAAVGSATYPFSDLFLASGGVINWANGDVSITHSTGVLTTNAKMLDIQHGTRAFIHVGGTTLGKGGILTGDGSNDDFHLHAGGYYDNGWIASAVTAGDINIQDGVVQVFTDSGLTVGNAYTPTARFTISVTGEITTAAYFSKSFTVDDNATVQLINYGVGYGFLVLNFSSSGVGYSIYSVGAQYYDPTEISDPQNKFTVTKDSASSINIYRDAGAANALTLQNKTGAPQTISLNYFR